MYACEYGYTDIALALIATGESNPGAQDKDGYTALMYACKSCIYLDSIHACSKLRKIIEVIFALIATGESYPEAQNKNGNTALIISLLEDYNIPEISVALIATGESNPGACNSFGNTALDYAKKKGMYAVFQELAYMRRRIVIVGEYIDYYWP
jgi:ankyrin repeat protein